MQITVPMYEKGRSFVMAAGLVKAYEGHKFVYLHLLCQGFENIGKALLLAHNYEKYGPLLRPPNLGHKLDCVLVEVNAALGHSFLSQDAAAELLRLNKFYKQQQLRYGDPIDFREVVSSLDADHLHAELVGHLTALNTKFA